VPRDGFLPTKFLASDFWILDDRTRGVEELIEHSLPMLLPAHDLDLDAQIADRDLLVEEAWHPYGILFGSQDAGNPAPGASLQETVDLPLRVAVVVGKTLIEFQIDPQPAQSLFKTFRRSDRAQRGGPQTIKIGKRVCLAGSEVLEFDRPVAGLDDRGRAIIAADPAMKFREVASIALGDQDMGGSSEVVGWLAKGSPRKKMLVAKGGLTIDQDDVEAAVQFQVLEPVVQDQEIASEFFYGVAAASDAVLVDDNGYAAEILGEHEGFVSGAFGIKKDSPPLGDDTHRGPRSMGTFSPDALVAPAQNRDPPSPRGEIARKFLDNGSLAGAAHGQISDAHDRAS